MRAGGKNPARKVQGIVGRGCGLNPTVEVGLRTNICFGGADLRTAYITLSGTGEDSERGPNDAANHWDRTLGGAIALHQHAGGGKAEHLVGAVFDECGTRVAEELLD